MNQALSALREAWAQPLYAGLQWLGLSLTPAQEELLYRYFLLLRQWNQRVNLTSLIEPAEVAEKHFIDSLTCLQAGFPEGSRVLDVGTGAGFPGLVLKIVRPDLDVTLLEAAGKKVTFLKEVIHTLGLGGVTPLHARAEEIGQDPAYRERYQRVVSRAVAELRILLEYALPLTEVGGLFLAQKGPRGEEELFSASRALSLLGGGEVRVLRFTLPLCHEERSILLVPKINPTPLRYPRRPGLPQKKPL